MSMVVLNRKGELISCGNDIKCTSFLTQLRDKSRKRSILDAFGETADALDHLNLSPRVKKVVRRPPPVLTVYVRRESEKAYNAIFMETVTVENFKAAVSVQYGIKETSIRRVALRSKTGVDKELDEQCLKKFVDEDDFIISLVYDNKDGMCDMILDSSS